MASKPSSGGVIRREGKLGGSSRYDPYAATGNKYDDIKEEFVRIGVELSLCVAESMFLLSDDMKSVLTFCYMICRGVVHYDNPVSDRLLRVAHHVYLKDIIPAKNSVPQPQRKVVPTSDHGGLIGSAWKDFAYAITTLHRIVYHLRRNDPRLPTTGTSSLKRRLLKNLEDKLRPVSEANGFARETIESDISDIWKSLFDEEEEAHAGQAKATKIRLLCDLFQPLIGESWQPQWYVKHGEKSTPIPPPYTLDKDFAKQELREEVVRLGVELSLYVAESMFLLCDDIRSVLSFCRKLWGAVETDLKQPNDSPVIDRLLRVIHHVYSKHIKPKNGVFQKDGISVQWKLACTSFQDLHAGIRDLEVFVREGSREFTSTRIDEAVKKVEEKLRCAKAVSEANGFARDAMESDILDIWKSLFDKETQGSWALRMMKFEIINDLFTPLL